MPRRVWLVIVALMGGVLLVTLSQPFLGDYGAYRVLTGFAASHWTWLAVVAGIAVALAGLRAPEHRAAGVVNLVAGLALATALALTGATTKGRVDPPAPDHTCHDGDNAAGVVISCVAEKAMSVLDVKPPPSQPRRWVTELVLGAYVVASGAASMRREA